MFKKINQLPERARIAIILLCLVIGFGCFYGAVRLNKVEDSYIISELKKALKKGESFIITVQDEAEREEVEKTINNYNKKKGYEEDACYKMYKYKENEYFVISERLWYEEFTQEMSNYYNYLGDMLSGKQSETRTFNFDYMNEEQEELFLMSISLSTISTDDLNLGYMEEVGEEVTFICIVVKLKENSEGAEPILRAHFYMIGKFGELSYYIKTTKHTILLRKIGGRTNLRT